MTVYMQVVEYAGVCVKNIDDVNVFIKYCWITKH